MPAAVLIAFVRVAFVEAQYVWDVSVATTMLILSREVNSVFTVEAIKMMASATTMDLNNLILPGVEYVSTSLVKGLVMKF